MTALDNVKKTMMQTCNSYERLGFVFEQTDNLSASEWFELLGYAWSGCDNIGHYGFEFGCSIFSDTFEHPNPIRAMMNEVENKAYNALGETVTVYRGCYEGLNENGFSWSTHKEIAVNFISLNRYKQTDGIPILITATFSRDDVAAVKLDRSEFELIIRPPSASDVDGIALSWVVEYLGGAA
jgi:hypothetical protein